MLKAYARARAVINSVRTDEEGATAVEYGLIAGLVSVVIIAALILVGTNLDAIFDAIATALGNATP